MGISFMDLGLREPEISRSIITVNDTIDLEVRNYLPIAEKINFINFVVNGALDDTTGCFSPVRLEVYFALGVCHWYGDIDFSEDELAHAGETYDLLEQNQIVERIMNVVSPDEMGFMRELILDTTQDIARYNASAAGIIRTMSADASGLDGQITEILQSIKDREGLDILSVIKDEV